MHARHKTTGRVLPLPELTYRDIAEVVALVIADILTEVNASCPYAPCVHAQPQGAPARPSRAAVGAVGARGRLTPG